jgi:hypothetical protein
MELMSKTAAYELILKMVISTQLANNVDDPKNQTQIDELADTYRKNISEAAHQQSLKFPDKQVAEYVLGIMRETIDKIYTDAAKQVRFTTAMHFSEMPSRERN